MMLDAADRPTAILYGSDLMAIAGLAAGQQRGLRIPGDLSVVGFDDGEISAHLPVPLSTVRTDAYGWGRAAACPRCGRMWGSGSSATSLYPPRNSFCATPSALRPEHRDAPPGRLHTAEPPFHGPPHRSPRSVSPARSPVMRSSPQSRHYRHGVAAAVLAGVGAAAA